MTAKKKKKKPKPKTKTYWKTRADGFFSQWIRGRDGICQATRVEEAGAEKCTREAFLQCAHIHSRSYSATRLDPDNAMALCRSCHTYFTPRPLEWKVFVDELYGEHYYDRLAVRALAGARRLVAVNWEDEAKKWEHEWTGGK